MAVESASVRVWRNTTLSIPNLWMCDVCVYLDNGTVRWSSQRAMGKSAVCLFTLGPMEAEFPILHHMPYPQTHILKDEYIEHVFNSYESDSE